MKKKLSKAEAREKIEEFFSQREFRQEDVKKIKRLAMKYRIPLKEHRKKFCKRCFSKLEGKTRIKGGRRVVECEGCGFLNKTKLRRS